MSARNGDKSRHGRIKKATTARRLRIRALRVELKAAAAAPKQESVAVEKPAPAAVAEPVETTV